jgi:hypothetical protein
MTLTMNTPLDDKALRKAWLKKKFASWEYHEELLKLHDEYLMALHRHWNDEGRQKRFPDFHQTMVSPVFFNFDHVQKPGEITKSEWDSKPTVGWADTISYNFNRGLGDIGAPFDQYVEMTQTERDHLNEIVAQMLRRCQNIKYTVDDRWIYKGSDDSLLDESYTGLITWPTNWRDDVANTSAGPLRCEAGRPCPREGLWFTPAKPSIRRYFHVGEVMPDVGGDFGVTIWQRDDKQ